MRAPARTLALLALATAAFAAHGQMYKCVDERGKVSYQEHPCAGTKSVPPPKARAASPAPASSQSPGASQAPAAEKLTNAQYRELIVCVDGWEDEALNRRTDREMASAARAQGRQGMPESILLHRDQGRMVNFLPKCQKFGFTWPTAQANDLAAEARNEILMRDLRRRVEAHERFLSSDR